MAPPPRGDGVDMPPPPDVLAVEVERLATRFVELGADSALPRGLTSFKKIPKAQGFDQRREGPLPQSPASRNTLIAVSNILPRNHGPIAGTTLEPP